MALGFVVASDIVSAALIYYIRGKALGQTIQDKPLLRALTEKQKTFPSGNLQLSEPVQGSFISDTPGAGAGFSEDDQLTFNQGQNILRAVYNWKQVHMGLGITWTELLKDGISISDNNKQSEHSDVEATRLTGIMENRMDDIAESWMRYKNNMLYLDGSQDSKAVPGTRAVILDVPTTGSTGGLSRTTYPWWQNRANLTLTASASDQTLTRFLRNEKIQLRRYGGKADFWPCGSAFYEALMLEVQAKGLYTQAGFKNGKTDIDINGVVLDGMTFEYDPALDDQGRPKYCYAIDRRRHQLRPMQGEEYKVLTPERPYNYMVFFRSITMTAALTNKQLNSCGVYALA